MTQLLVDFKTMLYIEGIGGRIDSGVWEAADKPALPGFAHLFVMRALGELIIGLIWSSKDGKGRERYPMVLVAQVRNVPMEWALDPLLRELEQVRGACQQASTAQGVINVLDTARHRLRELVNSVPTDQPELVTPPGAVVAVADAPQLGPARQGFLRVWYQLKREFGDLGKAGKGGRARTLRVPAVGDSDGASLLAWSRVLLSTLDKSVPVLLIARSDGRFVDVIAGEPGRGGEELVCLRASTKGLPLTSDIPYTIDPAFVQETQAWLERSKTEPAREVRGWAPRTREGRFSASG